MRTLKVYLWFNVFYLLFLVVLPVAAVWLWRRRFRKTSLILSVLPLLSAAVFAYMPNYNWNRQFEIFEAERTIENSRIPAGRWWASAEQMQRYDDNSAWEKFKGYFGRGEWPGGYPIWGLSGMAAAGFCHGYAGTARNGFSRRKQNKFAVGN